MGFVKTEMVTTVGQGSGGDPKMILLVTFVDWAKKKVCDERTDRWIDRCVDLCRYELRPFVHICTHLSIFVHFSNNVLMHYGIFAQVH